MRTVKVARCSKICRADVLIDCLGTKELLLRKKCVVFSDAKEQGAGE